MQDLFFIYGDDGESFAFIEPVPPVVAVHGSSFRAASFASGRVHAALSSHLVGFSKQLYTNRESVGAAKVTEAIGTYKSRCFRRLTGSSPLFYFA